MEAFEEAGDLGALTALYFRVARWEKKVVPDVAVAKTTNGMLTPCDGCQEPKVALGQQIEPAHGTVLDPHGLRRETLRCLGITTPPGTRHPMNS